MPSFLNRRIILINAPYNWGEESPIIDPPIITGSAIEGETLNVSLGTWKGTPSHYTYQWMRVDILVGGNIPILLDNELVYVNSIEAISGATNSSYVIKLNDAGYDGKDYILWCVVTAHYGTQNYAAISNATELVVPLYHQKAGKLLLRFNALGELPDANRRLLISDTFVGFEEAGWIGPVSTIHIKAAHARGVAKLNWMGDYANLTELGSLTFTVDRGFTGSGSGRLSLGVPLSSIPGYTRDDCHLGAWALTAGTAGRSLIGTGSSTTFRIRNNEGASERLVRVNTGTSLITNDNVTNGHVVGVRSSAGTQRSYRNGGDEQVGNATSSAIPTDNILYLSSFGTDSDAQIAVGHLGASLTAQQIADGYDVILAYLQGVGAIA